MFRFLHTADIHLNSPLKGLEVHADATPVEEIYWATRKASMPVPDNVTLYELRSQVQELLRAQLLRHGEPK